ncbi:uncharacterized protein LOC117590125 [Drosophila guanche]|uniref:Blast:Origin recognition complex subunit 6 n=1 Tax=Drosophila guanche TaxID=7266 RepID=A0A3B0JN47_DROGU|nr:uncharacterized protein LOC117590125 [Drosophila guanche]SPP74989.1 blast:Origin recognition complex subunit 6 [Drosophila guanche]
MLKSTEPILIREPSAGVRRQKSRASKMIGDYIDTAVRIAGVGFLADLIQRLVLSVVEHLQDYRYYLPEDGLSTILQRSFTYNKRSVFIILAFVVLALIRLSATGNGRALVPTAAYLAYMPLYWLFQCLGGSKLRYSHWIREPHGLDYASGMAANYFHGFLNLSLPERQGDGLRRRMAVYEATHNITFGLDRLIILIPDEMFVKGKLESDLLEKAEPLQTVNIQRAGVNRPFKHDVYRLKRMIDGKFYYFVIEGATPMLSFFESLQSQISATWQMREMKREIWLKFYKHLKYLLYTWPETRNLVEPIIYNSHDANGNLVDVGELLITRMENKKKKNA